MCYAFQFESEPSRRLCKHSNACPNRSTDRESVGNIFGSLREKPEAKAIGLKERSPLGWWF